MDTLVKERLQALSVGPAQQFQSLTILPLLDSYPQKAEYLTLRQAIESGGFVIREVSQGGSVPFLNAVNRGEKAVLLLDGEEVSGAKQNRVLNASVFVLAHSELQIPVSCTEAGRWSYNAPVFSDSGVIMSARHRQAKSAEVRRSLEHGQSFHADQGAVWDRVHRMHIDLGVASSTGAMRDAYETHRGRLDAFMEAFPLVPGQKGIAVNLGGSWLGLEVVSRAGAFSDLHQKLVQSYAMDALIERSTAPGAKEEPASLGALVEQILASEESRHRSPGAGWDYRYTSPAVVGSALVVEDEPIHLAFFGLQNGSSGHGPDTMAGFHRRRQFRIE